jgi:AcrR family transcriptional regulator
VVPTRAVAGDRTRAAVLEAAADLVAQRGTDVSMAELAEAAGVGRATLYRHFPTREALIEAAYANEVDRLCASAPELLAAHPPDVALAEWMDGFVSYAAAKRGMKSALQAVGAGESHVFAGARAKLLEAIAMLLAAGVDATTQRSDVDADDVLRGVAGRRRRAGAHAAAPAHGRASLRDLNSSAAATAPTAIPPAHQASATGASPPAPAISSARTVSVIGVIG